jgi:hypothetical protein
MLRKLVDDVDAGRPKEEATKLEMVRLDTAVEGLGSDAVQRMVPSIAPTIFIVKSWLIKSPNS